MASFLVRLSALLLSASLFALAYHEPSAKAEGYLGGCFFLGSVDNQASQMTVAVNATNEENRWASLS